jgi:hypothetical protein
MPIGTKCGMVKNVESNKFRMRRHNVDWLKMSKIRKYLKSLFFEKTIRYYNKSTNIYLEKSAHVHIHVHGHGHGQGHGHGHFVRHCLWRTSAT